MTLLSEFYVITIYNFVTNMNVYPLFCIKINNTSFKILSLIVKKINYLIGNE